MKLWIDGQCLQTPSRYRGIGRYVQEFIKALIDVWDGEVFVSLNADLAEEVIQARALLGQFLHEENVLLWEGAAEQSGEAVAGLTERRRLSHFALTHHVNSFSPNVALSAAPMEGAESAAVGLLPSHQLRVPTASIFYDAIPYRFPAEYLSTKRQNEHYRRVLSAYQHFDETLCISEFALAEFHSLYPARKATCISGGVSSDFEEMLQKDLPISFTDPYILYVGGLDWRKNVGLILDAFANLPEALRKRYKLVLAGDHPPFLVGLLREKWSQLKQDPDSLVSLSHVDNETLVSLYKNAAVLVQPSLMEGFGLTALEAMRCGTPVLAARAGALPEVVGRDDLLFDPQSESELAQALSSILAEDSKANSIGRELQVRARKFTWHAAAQRAAEALAGAACKNSAQAVVKDLRRNILSSVVENGLDVEEAAALFSTAEDGAAVKRDSSKRILVDVSSTVDAPHVTGIQRVVRRIVESLPNATKTFSCLPIANPDGEGFYARARSLSSAGSPDLIWPSRNDLVLMLDSSWTLLNEHASFIREARVRGCDVITCLYDLVPLKMPAYCDPGMPPAFTKWFSTSLEYSTGIICISKAVADEVISVLHGIGYPRPMKIGYWPLGADFVDQDSKFTEHEGQRKAQGPSFLMVGTIEPRKSYHTALEAFDMLWREGHDVKLVIVGRPGWNVHDVIDDITSHPHFGAKLIWESALSDEELRQRYAECSALVSTSLAEGFGLPIVEAHAFGKPIIASDLPVFREVAANAEECMFFEAGSASALYSTLQSFISSSPPDVLTKRDEVTSWQKSAAHLCEVVRDEKWYYHYLPPSKNPLISLADIGTTRMIKPLEGGETAHNLRVIGRPKFSKDKTQVELIIALRNNSEVVWSSSGNEMGLYGVRVSYSLHRYDGVMISQSDERFNIPFVVVPGDEVTLTVRIGVHQITPSVSYVRIRMVQDGVQYWSPGLYQALPDTPYRKSSLC